MGRRAFRIAYDGQPFRGFQRQPDVPTVEAELLEALRRLDVAPPDDTPPGYAAAGRTDADVSALAQTIALDCPAWLTPPALNGELPEPIRAWAVAAVSDGFHATHDAESRTYTYYLAAPGLPIDRARTAAARLSGRHDYHNLTPDDHGTTRDVDIHVARDGDFLVITVTAGGFPRNLVRRIVTLLDRASRGETTAEGIDRLLAPEPVDGPAGIPPAPAYPLVLTDVAYPGVRFQPTSQPDPMTRFIALDREYRSRARVVARVASGIDRERADATDSPGRDDAGRGNH